MSAYKQNRKQLPSLLEYNNNQKLTKLGRFYIRFRNAKQHFHEVLHGCRVSSCETGRRFLGVSNAGPYCVKR